MSGDAEQEYFADGMAEDIITQLSHNRALFVIARNSSFTYKGRAVDVKQIGRELAVRYVLEGSVRRAGERVRITAQFVEAETGNHIWAERYDRALADVFAVQDEISDAVATAIGPAIADAEMQRAMRRPPESLEAWDLYQQGCGICERRTRRRTMRRAACSNVPSSGIRCSPPLMPGCRSPVSGLALQYQTVALDEAIRTSSGHARQGGRTRSQQCGCAGRAGRDLDDAGRPGQCARHRAAGAGHQPQLRRGTPAHGSNADLDWPNGGRSPGHAVRSHG